VSRQPAQIRSVEFVENADNALFSFVTGGFEKRPPTQAIANLTFLDNTQLYKVHGVDRTETQQNFILMEGSTPDIIAIDAITGAQMTVTIGDSKRYFLVEVSGIDNTEIIEVDGVDYEKQVSFASETVFDWGFKLSDSNTVFKVEGSVDGDTWNDIATGKTGATGTFSTTIDAVATGDHNYVRFTTTTGAAISADTITVWATFTDTTYILNANPEDLLMTSVADYTFIVNRNHLTAMAEADSGTITSTVQTFAELPSATDTGNIHRIRGDDLTGFGTYYVKDNGTGDWVEIVDPTAHNNIDGSTMPHQLVRSSDGLSFTFSAASWEARPAGDELVNPQPGFIGATINDVTFYRNRLVLISDEIEYLSQSANVFSMFTEKATDILDSDPIERGATTNSVNILQYATTFRKILFATSAKTQFELSSTGSLTPNSAELTPVTEYTASPIAKPASMGDVLMFSSKTEGYAVVYEYFFQELTLSNKAADMSRHVQTYIPNDILEIRGDSTSTTMFLLSSGAQNCLYIFRTHTKGNDKVQAAWGKYTFGATDSNALIHGFEIFSGFVVMIIERDDGNIYLEQFPIEREALVTDMPFMPLLDQRELLTGTYNSTHDVTHWTTSYEFDDDAEVSLGAGSLIPARQLDVTYTDKYSLTLSSVVAGETLIIGGKTFTAHTNTTTTANREFDISGIDSADGDELVVVLNDSTDGIGGTHSASNASGVVTVVPLDKVDGTITAPTGTTIDNATIVALKINNLVAAREDHTADDAYVGRDYTMTVELSRIFVRDNKRNNIPIVTGRLQLLDMTILYEKSAYFELKITPSGGRDSFSYKFEGKELGSNETLIDSASIANVGKFGHKKIISESEETKIEIINDQPAPSVITGIQWRGQFNEIGRQG
jgi:hypothetical protein